MTCGTIVLQGNDERESMSENEVTVELDMAYDEDTPHEAALRVEREYDVRVVIVREDGTANGWPEVAVTGDVAKVIAVLIEAWGMGAQEALFVLGYDPGANATLDL